MVSYMDAANTLIAFWDNEINKMNDWYGHKIASTDDQNYDWYLWKDADTSWRNLNQVHDQLTGISEDLAKAYTTLADTWSGPAADAYKKMATSLQDYINDLVDRAKLYAQAAYDTSSAHNNAINLTVVVWDNALDIHNEVWNNPGYRNALIDSARDLDGGKNQGTIDKFFSTYDKVDKYYHDNYITQHSGHEIALFNLNEKYQGIYPTLKYVPSAPSGDNKNGTGTGTGTGTDTGTGSGNWDSNLTDTDGDGVPDAYDGAPNDPSTANPPTPDTKTPDLKDSDGDGVADVYDGSPHDPSTANPPTPDNNTPDLKDSDGDGVADVYDGSPNDSSTANPPPPPSPDTSDTGLDNGQGDGLSNNLGSDNQPPPELANLPPPSAGAPPPPPPPSNFATGPDGTRGFDVTGNGVPDIGLGGNILSNGNLPPGSKVVRSPSGATGVDLDGDGVPDVDLAGNSLHGGNAPPGGQLATGPDGTTGFDVTGNGVPDLNVDGRSVLPTGNLPPGSSVVRGPDGQLGIDLNHDGTPDVDFAGHALAGGSGPAGSSLVTTPDGQTGYDLNGDGQPDVDVHGAPLSPTVPPPGGGNAGGGNVGGGNVGGGNAGNQIPGNQIIPGPGGGSESFPGRPAAGGTFTSGPGGPQVGSTSGAGTGITGRYPPMMPPMMPPHAGPEGKERETWLQEEDEIWAGDDLVVASVLGRPSPAEDEEAAEAAWETPAEPARTPKSRPRQQRPTGGYPEQSPRRF
jgi:hypothetical protein